MNTQIKSLILSLLSLHLLINAKELTISDAVIKTRPGSYLKDVFLETKKTGKTDRKPIYLLYERR